MCTFVTLIAETQDLDGLNAALASIDANGQKRRAEKIVTPGLRPLLRAQETEYWLVRTPCDCGTFLGHAAGGDDDGSAGTGNPAASYRRRGWSQARIGRAIAHRQTARPTTAAKAERRRRLLDRAAGNRRRQAQAEPPWPHALCLPDRARSRAPRRNASPCRDAGHGGRYPGRHGRRRTLRIRLCGVSPNRTIRPCDAASAGMGAEGRISVVDGASMGYGPSPLTSAAALISALITALIACAEHDVRHAPACAVSLRQGGRRSGMDLLHRDRQWMRRRYDQSKDRKSALGRRACRVSRRPGRGGGLQADLDRTVARRHSHAVNRRVRA